MGYIFPNGIVFQWHSCSWVSCSCSLSDLIKLIHIAHCLTNDVCNDRVTRPICMCACVSVCTVDGEMVLRDAKHPTFLINYRPQAHLTNVITCKFIRPLFHILLAWSIHLVISVDLSIWLCLCEHWAYRKSCNEYRTE